jgi:hypothetical protein
VKKITWSNPDDDEITRVCIYRSSTKNGSYNIVSSVNSTNDGDKKTVSNQWATCYTDTGGNRTDWYKLRFYYGTYSSYSDYSDSATELGRTTLCGIEDVKKYVDTIGRFSPTEIFEKIKEIDSIIYTECGRPLAESRMAVNDDYYKYYIGESDVYRVDRLFYGTTTKSEYYEDDSFVLDKTNGIVRILPVASSNLTLNNVCDVYVRYVPMVFSKLSALRTAKALIEETDTTAGGKISKELQVINSRLAIIEELVSARVGILFSGDRGEYDTEYGISAKTIYQDFDINAYTFEEP